MFFYNTGARMENTQSLMRVIMFIIGITGSIGSGKSTIIRILADMTNIPIVDADSVTREFVEPSREALVSIVRAGEQNYF